MNLSKLWEIVEDRGAWRAAVHGLQRVRHDLAAEQLTTILCLTKKWKSLVYILKDINLRCIICLIFKYSNHSCCCCYVTSVVSDSVWHHRWQPTRLPHPWDSPGKNTGTGCHFLLQCLKVKNESEVSQLCPTLSDPMDCSPPGSSICAIFQAKVLEWVAIAFSKF